MAIQNPYAAPSWASRQRPSSREEDCPMSADDSQAGSDGEQSSVIEVLRSSLSAATKVSGRSYSHHGSSPPRIEMDCGCCVYNSKKAFWSVWFKPFNPFGERSVDSFESVLTTTANQQRPWLLATLKHKDGTEPGYGANVPPIELVQFILKCAELSTMLCHASAEDHEHIYSRRFCCPLRRDRAEIDVSPIFQGFQVEGMARAAETAMQCSSPMLVIPRVLSNRYESWSIELLSRSKEPPALKKSPSFVAAIERLVDSCLNWHHSLRNKLISPSSLESCSESGSSSSHTSIVDAVDTQRSADSLSTLVAQDAMRSGSMSPVAEVEAAASAETVQFDAETPPQVRDLTGDASLHEVLTRPLVVSPRHPNKKRTGNKRTNTAERTKGANVSSGRSVPSNNSRPTTERPRRKKRTAQVSVLASLPSSSATETNPSVDAEIDTTRPTQSGVSSMNEGRRQATSKKKKSENCRRSVRLRKPVVQDEKCQRTEQKKDACSPAGYPSYNGVSWSKQSKRWRAYFSYAGKIYWLGSFCTKAEASCASKAAKEFLFRNSSSSYYSKGRRDQIVAATKKAADEAMKRMTGEAECRKPTSLKAGLESSNAGAQNEAQPCRESKTSSQPEEVEEQPEVEEKPIGTLVLLTNRGGEQERILTGVETMTEEARPRGPAGCDRVDRSASTNVECNASAEFLTAEKNSSHDAEIEVTDDIESSNPDAVDQSCIADAGCKADEAEEDGDQPVSRPSYRGYSRCKSAKNGKQWRAHFLYAGKKRYLGSFVLEEQASRAVEVAKDFLLQKSLSVEAGPNRQGDVVAATRKAVDEAMKRMMGEAECREPTSLEAGLESSNAGAQNEAQPCREYKASSQRKSTGSALVISGKKGTARGRDENSDEQNSPAFIPRTAERKRRKRNRELAALQQETAGSASKKRIVQLFAADFNGQLESGERGRAKRKIKSVVRFDATPPTLAQKKLLTAASGKTGVGFSCPRCSVLCLYNEQECPSCHLPCRYVPGTGVVVLRERNESVYKSAVPGLLEHGTAADLETARNLLSRAQQHAKRRGILLQNSYLEQVHGSSSPPPQLVDNKEDKQSETVKIVGSQGEEMKVSTNSDAAPSLESDYIRTVKRRRTAKAACASLDAAPCAAQPVRDAPPKDEETTSEPKQKWTKLDHAELISNFTLKHSLPIDFGPTPSSALEAVELQLSEMDISVPEYDDEYESEMKLYNKGVTDRKRMADAERIEKVKYKEDCERRRLELEYSNRNRKRSQQDIEYESFLSRPIHFECSKERKVSKPGKCKLGIDCELCAPDSGAHGEPFSYLVPSFRQLSDEEILKEDDGFSTRRPSRNANSTRKTVAALTTLKHNLKFVVAYNKGPLERVKEAKRGARSC